MKIYVYAICKNEEKFVERWVESMKEADDIFVLDTGSTDQTVKKLKEKNVHVQVKKITPWRFDVARNESLKMVPDDADICVCTDLDEIFDKGWRKKLEDAWQKDTTRARYNYNWKLDNDGNPEVNFYIEKIHIKKDYIWTHPVHEVLSYKKENEKFITLDQITLNHYPDSTKSRSSYLPLLELSVKEDKDDDRNLHYLGREYMYYGKYQQAITTLKKHLKNKNATWNDEKSASMRFIGRCYKNLGNIKQARFWYNRAIKLTPYLRDPLIEKALLEYEQENYSEVENLCLKALRIKTHQKTYINEIFSFNETVYDLLSLSCYFLGKYNYAIYFIDLAIEKNPQDERLQNNKTIFLKKDCYENK